MRAILVALALVASITGGLAADPEPIEIPAAVETREIIFDLGGGVTMSPKWPSSKIYEPGALPLFRLRFLRIPVFGEVVGGEDDGPETIESISIFPSFEYVNARDSSDASYLRGIPDRDFALEVGPGASIRLGSFRAAGVIRYAFVGHGGFVGDLGVDYVGTPFERLEIAVGPRMGIASDNYMDTYFGVPASAAVLPQYNPSGGIKDLGFKIDAEYELTEKVRLVGRAEWRHFVFDALDSPITKAGNDQEFMVGVGLTYRFGFNLFD